MSFGTRQKPKIPTHIKYQILANAIIDGKTRTEAAEAAGMSLPTANRALSAPTVQRQIEVGLQNATLAASVTRSWIIAKLREVAERCMQSRPVLDKLGHPTGLYVFDSTGANRSLELLGKHLRIFGDDNSAQSQLGAAVIRVLAQEAQAGRERVQPIEAQIVEGPIRQEQKESPKTSVSASLPPIDLNSVPPPPVP